MSGSRAAAAWRRGWPALGVGSLVLAVLSPALLTRSVFFERDILAYWYPGIAVFRRAIAEGAWPVWNPYSGFGTPFLADPNFQLAYPPTWLNLLVAPAAYYKLFVALHCLLGGLGTLALARRHGLSSAAGFAAAALFAASGPLVSAANLFHHFAGAAWMPWVLWALERLIGGSNRRSWIALGVTVALQVLAGSFDLVLMTLLAGAFRALTHLVAHGPRRAAEAFRLALGMGKGAALAGVLSAIQWMPTLSLAFGSARSGQGVEASAFWSVHPVLLLDLVVPRLVSDFPMSEALRELLLDGREPLLRCLYWSVPALALAMLARSGIGRTWALATLGVFLVAALGRHTAFHSLLSWLPGFGYIRYPVKFLLPASLCLALLAAFGFEGWRCPWNERDRRRGLSVGVILCAGAAVAVAAALWMRTEPQSLVALVDSSGEARSAFRGSIAALLRTAAAAFAMASLFWLRSRARTPPGWLSIAALGLAVTDLGAVASGINRLAPPELAEHRPATTRSLLPRDGTDGARIHAASRPSSCWREIRNPPGWDERWARSLALTEALSPPAGARWGIYGSYDGEFSGLGAKLAAPIVDAARRYEGTALGLRFLRMGGVDYVVAVGDKGYEGLTSIDELPSRFPCPLRVFRVPEPQPRAYLVDGVREQPSGDPLAALADPDFDPARSVLLPAPEPSRDPTGSFRGTARIVWRRTDALRIDAQSSAPAVLVILESFARGWRATLDGRPVKVQRANVLFRAVRVPPGRHVVELSYRPREVIAGAFLSAAGLIGLVVFKAFDRRPAPLAPPERPQVASGQAADPEVHA